MNTYNAIPGNVSLASAVQVSVPADGVDSMAVSTVNTGLQKEADYLEAIRQMIIGTGVPINEGFEGSVFPPTSPSGAWSAPSSRFNTDTAWIRTAVGPLAGVASASAPTPQTLSTNSSMGLQTFLFSPSRLQFVFAVTSNANNGDHLDFFIDGILTAQFSSTTGPVAVAGTFITDLLTVGAHTFDWRFVRGASASVASEKCLVDSVQVISEESWRTDPTLSRLYMFDDMTWANGPIASSGFALTTANSPAAFFSMLVSAGGNTGTIALAQNASGLSSYGEVLFTNASVAAGDSMSSIPNFNSGVLTAQFPLSKNPFAEWRVNINTITPGAGSAEVGLRSTGSDFAGWCFDGAVSIVNWRWRTRTSGGVQTDVDSGVAWSSSSYFRLGTIASTVGGISSVIFLKDGKALPGAANIPPILTTNLPTIAAPGFRIKSGAGASTYPILVDYLRYLGLR